MNQPLPAQYFTCKCGANLRLVIRPPRFADVECDRCDYKLWSRLKHHPAGCIKRRVLQRQDFFGIFLILFHEQPCRHWKQAVLRIGLAHWLWSQTTIKFVNPDISTQFENYFHYLNEVQNKLGDALQLSLTSHDPLWNVWFDYKAYLDTALSTAESSFAPRIEVNIKTQRRDIWGQVSTMANSDQVERVPYRPRITQLIIHRKAVEDPWFTGEELFNEFLHYINFDVQGAMDIYDRCHRLVKQGTDCSPTELLQRWESL